MTPLVRRGLVVFALTIVAACVIAAAAAPMKGFSVYEDKHGCAERAWGNLFAFEHGNREPCEPEYELVAERPAAGWWIAVLLAPTAIIGLLLAWRPRRLWSVVWSAVTLGVSIAYFFATFSLDFSLTGKRVISHGAAHAVSWAVAAIYLLHVVQLLAIGVHAAVTGIRDWRRRKLADIERMPRATVVKR